LGYVIRFFANPKEENYFFACLSAAGVVVSSLLIAMCIHPACFLAVRIALKARVTWCTFMYKKVIYPIIKQKTINFNSFLKALKLKPSAFGKTTIGQILNLMSNDVSRFDEVFNA
jgi:ATP-binding cassette subfamily C (CFTR/MRP) protein 4